VVALWLYSDEAMLLEGCLIDVRKCASASAAAELNTCIDRTNRFILVGGADPSCVCNVAVKYLMERFDEVAHHVHHVQTSPLLPL
jgi:hypothetical protein